MLPSVVHDNNVGWHSSKALEVEISAFLKQYDEAFTTFDGDQLAALYCIPTRAVLLGLVVGVVK